MQDWYADYARDLLAEDRAAIIQRYHPDGAWIVRRGVPRLLTFAELVARYQGEAWQPPRSFAWRGLAFDPVGDDGMLVVGQFLWQRPAGTVERMSYTGLLKRVSGHWRIRLEDENLAETFPTPSAAGLS